MPVIAAKARATLSGGNQLSCWQLQPLPEHMVIDLEMRGSASILLMSPVLDCNFSKTLASNAVKSNGIGPSPPKDNP